MKKIKLSVDIWKTEVFIWICTREEAQKEFKKTIFVKKFNSTTEFDGHGKTLYIPGYSPIIWIWSGLNKNAQISALSHEFMHVINGILLHKGINLTEETDEVYAYFMEYLMNQIFKKI